MLTVLTEDLVASGYGDEIKVWNIKEGFEVQNLKGHKEDIVGIRLASNNRLLSASEDNTIKVWDYVTGDCKQTIERHYKPISAFGYVDNHILVSAD